MAKIESLGLKRLESIHFYVNDLERSRKFYTSVMDFVESGSSDPDLESRAKQKSVAFQAGDCTVLVSQPAGEGGRAWRFLQKHPDGVGTLVFEVDDIEKTFSILEKRGGTPIEEIQTTKEGSGTFRTFSVTTPFGDTTFRFVQRDGFSRLFPGFAPYGTPRGGKNSLGFTCFDHCTSNFQTLAPAILWMEHVMGFERYWEVQFHTSDVADTPGRGSGLKSIVMWDPKSGAKFANNEPFRPYFKKSQINIFNEELRGDGVQHVALSTRNIQSTVRSMLDRKVEFMPTPGSYYDALPTRIERMGLKSFNENLDELRKLEILMDGNKDGYLLQIFLKEGSGLYKDKKAGPFFFEVIQRKGNQGFGEGNFRALFESIEYEQLKERRM